MNREEIDPQQIDPDARRVIHRLVASRHEAYLVGGCVRDLLLDYIPKDVDIATSATPHQVKQIFRNSRIIGRRFRLVHIFFGEKIFQVATFRAPPQISNEDTEGEQDFLIRSDNVFGNAIEDAERRDFTINGLFYDLAKQQVIDYVGGMDDIRTRQIRMIGDPNIRFQEDPVRLLRAIRFSARLAFDIEDKTYAALLAHHKELSKSAPPRLLEELYKLLRSGASLESFVLMGETKILDVLLPDLASHLRNRPTDLDPYLQKLDQCTQSQTSVENATLLFILGSVTFEQLPQKNSQRTLFEDTIQQGIHALASRLPIPRIDATLLHIALGKVFWPSRHSSSHRKDEKLETIISQISEFYLYKHPGFDVSLSEKPSSGQTLSRKKRTSRRRRTKKSPPLTSQPPVSTST